MAKSGRSRRGPGDPAPQPGAALKALDTADTPAMKAAASSRNIETGPLSQIRAAVALSRDLEAGLTPQHKVAIALSRNQDYHHPQAPTEPDVPPSEEPSAVPATARHPVQSITSLGELLKTTRLRLGLTQQEVAYIGGVSRRFISELEAGKPTLQVGKVLQVCAGVGLDLFAEAR